ncbi:MAG: AMP-binding protein, partial [Chlamydiae bacterium]|nr:AMP-binding protein [Chlamydiota bacterium]
MKEKTFRLTEPFQGEKNLIEIEYNDSIVELPCIPQVHFPLEMSRLTEIGPIPRAFFVASEQDILRAKNASTIKVKITHLDFEPSLELLKSTLSQTGAKIRIDANRTLSLDEVKILASVIPKGRLDFFEEPTKNIEEVLELNIPLAIDESFLEKGWENRLRYQQVVAAVVKPYRVFYKPIYNLSQKLGKRFILSSSLEDSTPILKLATYLSLYDEPIGIDVDRFKVDVVMCPIKKADPASIAIITQTERISYLELDERINRTSVEEGEVLSKLPKLEAVIRFFALLRQGIPVAFHRPQKPAEAKTLDSIPLETCITLISSGTTGSPKEIVWKWGQLWANIQDQFSSYPLFQGASYRGNLNLSRIGGLMACLRPLLSGGTLILDEKSYADYENMVPTQIIKKLASKEGW